MFGMFGLGFLIGLGSLVAFVFGCVVIDCKKKGVPLREGLGFKPKSKKVNCQRFKRK